ncbi:MAG TPA: outer membrane beta-barrel protein, partial [Alphaproteobacteria bacterium]|nr:outer membrane beta-barrel protein [Alphaproteobacteria bacterium]
GEVSALLYDATVTFRPDETLELKGEFSTGFGAPGPDSAAAARLEYAAAGEAAYTVNPWLKLRASAGWSHAQLVGTPETETSYHVGLGADYVLNEFTTLTGDYVYTSTATTPDPAEDSHRVSVGMTFSR